MICFAWQVDNIMKQRYYLKVSHLVINEDVKSTWYEINSHIDKQKKRIYLDKCIMVN